MTTTTVGANPMIELDAREFGLHLKEGGWRLGLLVARSVEPGVIESGGAGGGAVAAIAATGKVSASRFAEDAGTSGERVMRYYRAWERYATKKKVPHASQLAPGDEPELDWERLPRWTLSEAPSAPGATGELNLTIHLGKFGERLLRAHKRLITFLEKDLPGAKTAPSAKTRNLAGRYAACLETEARLLRMVEAGEQMPAADELRMELDPSRFFETA